MIDSSIVYRDFKGKYEYLPLARAEGSLIWDQKGKQYIDFTSAWNVTNLGWNHLEVNEAIVEQTKKNVQCIYIKFYNLTVNFPITIFKIIATNKKSS